MSGENITAMSQASVDRTEDARDLLRETFLDARLRWQALPPLGAQSGRLDEAWVRLEESLDEEKHKDLRRQVMADAVVPADERSAKQTELCIESLVDALPLVRDAVRLMEEVYHQLPLGGDPGSVAHRRSLVWLNRFGRWTGAPYFRAWWPWMVPLLSSETARYFERALALRPFRECKNRLITIAGRTASGGDYQASDLAPHYAAARWFAEREFEHQRLFEPRQDEPKISAALAPLGAVGSDPAVLYGYCLDFGEPWGVTNVGVVEVWTIPAEKKGARPTACWEADHLYVPPGLWGLGIGEDFLAAVVKKLRVLCQHDRIRVPTPHTTGEGRQSLYSGAGFHRAEGAGEHFFEFELKSGKG